MYHGIEKVALSPLPTLEQRSKSWIYDASWWIIDQNNVLHKLSGPTNITEYNCLIWGLKASLKEKQDKNKQLLQVYY